MSTELKGRLCTIYTGSRKAELYIYVDRKDGLASVPESLLQTLGTLREVMTLHITPERRLARVRSVQVLEDIERQGFFVQMPPQDVLTQPAGQVPGDVSGDAHAH